MDNKLLVLMVGPFGTRSGYGEHAKDIFHSFYDIGKYDIIVIDTPWGNTPRNALDINNSKDKLILDRIFNPNEPMQKQPDICVDIRIPNEFRPVGKFNIGITAGIETTAVSQQWIDGMNRVDLCIVPSNFSKEGFDNTKYDKMQQMPDGQQQKVGELRVEKPIEVLFEGADEDIYKPLTKDEIDSEFFDMINNKIPEKFAFLFVGTWTKGGFGEDRKDIGNLIKTFYETFVNQKNQPALLLKTQGAGFSILDKEEILQKINGIKNQFPKQFKLPPIYFLHGDLSNEEMNYLYNHPKMKAMVSFTHGEGFGRPLLEATMTGLPIIASNWSGHTDFLDDDHCVLLPGSVNKIPEGAVWNDVLIPESSWFNVNTNEASKLLKFAHKNAFDMRVRSKKLMKINKNKFSHNKMTEKLNEILEKYTSNLSVQVPINLPKLEPVQEQKSPTVKLPKLEKV